MRGYTAAAALLAIHAPWTGLAQPAPTPPEGPFDPAVVQEIWLRMRANDWAALQANYLSNDYYQAELEWLGQPISSVGVRSRGNGSRNMRKPGLRIDFNRYVKNQQFSGLRAVVLDNHWQDGSFLHERLAMMLFSRLEIPAPRQGYARLYVNGQYIGLYSPVEEVGQAFLARAFGEQGGSLYKYDWSREWRLEWLGDNQEAYVPGPFRPLTRAAETDAASIVALVKAVHQPGEPEFLQEVGRRLDLKQFVVYLAVESFLSDGDGLLGKWGMNNFYLYRRTNSTQFQLIPWDKDGTFEDPELGVLHGADRNALTRRLLALPEYAGLYLDTLEELAQKHGGLDNWMDVEATRVMEMLRESVLADPNKQFTNSECEFQADHVLHFLRTRPDSVLEQVGRLRAAGGRLIR